jgi:phage FluMu protein Com
MYVACSKCDKTIAQEEAHRYQKKKGQNDYFCPDCKRLIDLEFQQETENPNYGGAVAVGALAGIAGGALWYVVEIFMNFRFGYIGLAVGYLVGWAVILGAGKKRGPTLQAISAVISLVAVLGASYLSVWHQIGKALEDMDGLGGQAAGLAISPFSPEILSAMVSGPMSLVIWAFAVYIGYQTPKARKL